MEMRLQLSFIFPLEMPCWGMRGDQEGGNKQEFLLQRFLISLILKTVTFVKAALAWIDKSQLC